MRVRPRVLVLGCVAAVVLLRFAYHRCPAGTTCTPSPPPVSTDEDEGAVRRYPLDAAWRPVCYPWEPPIRCEGNAAEAATCSRDEVISRFHRKYGVLWMLANSPDNKLTRAADGTVTATVINHGRCRTDCATHLWGLLRSIDAGDAAAQKVVIAAHEMKQLNESAIALAFAVPRLGSYSLTIEQRFWHGNSTSVESGDFNFAARNLDMATYWARFGAHAVASGAHYKAGTDEARRLLSWQKIRSRWTDSRCLQILGSPYIVRIVPHEQTQPSKTTTANPGSGPASTTRRCTIEDLVAPGAWVSPLPDYLRKNSFLGELNSAWEPLRCQWRGFDKPELDQCLDRIHKFYIVGDSLMRMKVEKLIAFGVPRAMIEDHVKRKGGAGDVPTMASLSNNTSVHEMADSQTRFSVVVDDLGLVFDAWHGTLASFASRLDRMMQCAPALDASVISVFYATHYINEYRGDRITPPRVAQFNDLAATFLRQKRQGGNATYVFDTQMPTRARMAVNDSEDGLHYTYTRFKQLQIVKSDFDRCTNAVVWRPVLAVRYGMALTRARLCEMQARS